MKANTHDTGGEVQYGDHWGDPVRMGWTDRDDSTHLDELGHKFPIALRELLYWACFARRHTCGIPYAEDRLQTDHPRSSWNSLPDS